MDWQALLLSAELATATLCVLLPVALWMVLVMRMPAAKASMGRGCGGAAAGAAHTVLGYTCWCWWAGSRFWGSGRAQVLGVQLAFSFWGLLLASVVFNVPFCGAAHAATFRVHPAPADRGLQVRRPECVANLLAGGAAAGPGRGWCCRPAC